MHWLDYVVLIGYFAAMAGIGVWSMRRIKKQEDYFLGGRSFGKVLQAFAAFGAGTGSSDPINTARTSFTGGLSGMWSIMTWLFVTPFYWITGVWYRRMRHTTLGDWFVERYESKPLGVAYTIFGLIFYMVYISMLFTAIGKVVAPLMGETATLFGMAMPIEYVLVPIIAIVVIVYGVMGGITAAYWTDLIQGLCIILLSIILIPFGLNALVAKFGDPATQGMMDGFTIMHEQVSGDLFTIIGSTNASEFPVYRIVAVVVILLVGVVVMPHFIATGGGTAKTEFNARVGLVAGNFAKRFCTIGWALTALIILALMADSPELAADPDKTWGVASRELLGPGLLGLMVACLLAALMSSVDCYMIVCSALVVRNIYAPYINPEANDERCIVIGRITGIFIVIGGVIFSWILMDVFKQLQLTWIVPTLFAAPFWIGMYWRKATTRAAWITIAYGVLIFFLIPQLAPIVSPSLRENPRFAQTNHIVETTTTRPATPADVARRSASIQLWEQAENPTTEKPGPLNLGETVTTTIKTGGKAIYWSGGVAPIGEATFDLIEESTEGNTTIITKRHHSDLKGAGTFQIDFLLYDLVGVPLKTLSNAMLETLSILPKIVMPFLVMILFSLFTRPNSKEALDRYYLKMKTPVDPDREKDLEQLAAVYKNPDLAVRKPLFPGTSLEIQKPTVLDVVGFIGSVALCFGIIWLAVLLAKIGA